MRRKLLPFYGERNAKIDMIVLHSVGFEPQQAIKSFEENEVCSHYIIGSDGETWQLAGEKRRAYHAGKLKLSYWRGREALNAYSIGIELCSLSLGQKAFTKAQFEALIPLLKRLIKKYKIKPENIVGHSDVSPNRKPDPGKAFFWKELAMQGIGLWYSLKDAAKMQEDDPEELLRIIGYNTDDLQAALFAFCRHFIPEVIPTVKDIVTLVETPVDRSLDFTKNEKVLKVLKAVAYKYLTASSTPCKI